MKKKIVSFTIDESVLIKFNQLSNELCINKSKFIEKQLIKFIKANENLRIDMQNM